jgi:hypothetical protein
VTRFEREGDQQPAQPGARHLGDGAVAGADLEWPKHPDLHLLILPRAIRPARTAYRPALSTALCSELT